MFRLSARGMSASALAVAASLRGPVCAAPLCWRTLPSLSAPRARWLSTAGTTGAASTGASVVRPRRLQIIVSTSTDPFFNLGTEEWMFNRGGMLEGPVLTAAEVAAHPPAVDVQTLFLWRNAPSVIIGVFQNPWKECHVQKLNE
jgi:hypothetical protein